MNDWPHTLRAIEPVLRDAGGHFLAEVLKLVAAEIQHRNLPGHQLLYDVAFELHAVTSADRVADAVARYYQRPPPA